MIDLKLDDCMGDAAPLPFPGRESGLLPDDAEAFRALYLHIPFCKRRCLYCDFATEAIDALAAPVRTYVENLIRAVRRASREDLLGSIDTVYIGGGTPTFIGQGLLTEILYTLSLSMHLTDEVECTIEANPDSVTLPLVRDMWALGANRISIGVQSFDDGVLEVLGRVHDADDARRAVSMAQDRFENVSVDMMCGVPGQTLESFEESVRCAVALGVAHVSVYPLTIEEQTPFARMVDEGRLADINEDFQATCMELAADVLAGAGYARYEVASYAKPGFACRHNKAYWSAVPYLGLGASAVSMVQGPAYRIRVQDGDVVERIGADEALAEDLMLGMRMTEGLSQDMVDAARLVFPEFDSVARDLSGRGLARWDGGRFVPTDLGWLCGNELYGTLLDLAPSL